MAAALVLYLSRGDDQHDDPGGARHRRRGGGGRRHHRHREHRAAAPPATPARAQTSRSRAIILDASLEVRGPIVYATLIDRRGGGAGLLPGGPVRRLLPSRSPLAYALAVLASMVVALTVTPALSLILLRKAPLERRESPLVRWLQRGYDRCARADHRHGRARRTSQSGCDRAGRARAGTAARAVAAPDVQGTRLPDALADRARHLASGDDAGSRPRPAGSCETIPGSATSARTSGRRCSPTRWSASTSARTGSASTRMPTTTRPWTTIEEVVDGYPGLFRDVQTYLQERDRRGPDGLERGGRRAHLRRRPGRSCAARPTRCAGSSRR